jgi:hypothetical protein
MSDESVVEVYADYPESAERRAEEAAFAAGNDDIYAIVAESV